MREFVKDTKQINAVRIPCFTETRAGQSGIELKTLRLIAVAHRFDQQPARFGHAQCSQTVEHRESLLAHDALQARLGVGFLAGAVVGQGVTQDARGFPLCVVEVAQVFQRRDRARGRVQAVVVLELPGELFFLHLARIVYKALKAISCGLIKGHCERPGKSSWGHPVGDEHGPQR